MRTKKEQHDYNAAYHLAHREKILERKRRLAKTKKGRSDHAKRSLEYYYRHRDRVMLRNLARLKEIKRIVFEHYGNKCVCCGLTEKAFLCMDHVNGGGSKHRATLNTSSYAIYRWIIKNNFPKDFQVLCWNCNSAKHFFKICPHKNTF